MSNTIQPSDHDGDETTGKLSVVHDLYVDLLGSLVPGLLTVILGSAVVLLTFWTVHAALFQQSFNPNLSPGGLKEVIPSLHWEIATVIVVSSYVIGAVFFRQDPKNPDALSALHVWMNAKPGERDGLAVQPVKDPTGMTFDSDGRPCWRNRLCAYFFPHSYLRRLGLDTQFPYFHLRCYLTARGLTHLIRFVPWCPEKEETKGFRTKMFINILKVRLISLFPKVCRDIIRNEAHVRLATSVWYALTSLLYLCGVALIVLLAVSPSCIRDGLGSPLFLSSTLILLLTLFCVAMRHHLRKCIHYMRVREVIYVLEAAHLAEQNGYKSVFVGLSEKDKSNNCEQCPRMKLAVPAPDGGDTLHQGGRGAGLA